MSMITMLRGLMVDTEWIIEFGQNNMNEEWLWNIAKGPQIHKRPL
jgi:hypothetical protein